VSAGVEIEVKLAVTDRDGAARRLVEVGATIVTARDFEDNWLFDHPDGRLKQQKVMVRLRECGGRAWLTLKEELASDAAAATGDYKVRQETETACEDGNAIRAVLKALGMVVAYRYQKHRATYRIDDLLITLDEVPIGVYIELEGAPDDIDRCARRLGYSRDDYINVSYRALQRRTMRDGDDEPVEMLFDDEARR